MRQIVVTNAAHRAMQESDENPSIRARTHAFRATASGANNDFDGTDAALLIARSNGVSARKA